VTGVAIFDYLALESKTGVAMFDLKDDRAAADGHVVHVFVDREARKRIPIQPGIRTALTMLVKPQT